MCVLWRIAKYIQAPNFQFELGGKGGIDQLSCEYGTFEAQVNVNHVRRLLESLTEPFHEVH